MTPTTEASPAWRRAMDHARQAGWGAALAALHSDYAQRPGNGAVLPGPGGHAIVPTGYAYGAEPGAVVLRVAMPGLVALRLRPVPATADSCWVTALAGLRLGLSNRLLSTALAYLGGRVVEGAPLLHQQMVKGDVADVVLEQLEILALLEGAGPSGLSGAAAADVHGQITRADRRIMRLLGAGGYVLDGPGATAQVSELIADVYAGPAWSEADPWRAESGADAPAAPAGNGARM